MDEAYLREAILNPSQHNVAGFAPIMPTYQGQISEEGLIDLVEYLQEPGHQLPHAADAEHTTATEPTRRLHGAGR